MPQTVDVRDRGTGWWIAAWSITLVPQRPDQPATERPWFEFVPAHEDAPSLPPRRPNEPGVAWFKYVLGFFGGCPISLLLVPLTFLAGVILVHTRLGGLALVALATSLLLVYIWADARRIEKELIISGDLSRPEYQRDLACARASNSFFHKLDLRTTP